MSDDKDYFSAIHIMLEDMDQRWQKACKERDELRAENAHLKNLLFYSRHAVDHSTCLEPPYAPWDCWRCRIDKALEAK